MFSILGARGAVDENFYIYLCFGQSNMEGNAQPESVDQTVDERFQMLACVNFQNPVRTMGNWYPATPPIVRQGTGLGMADYFGRTMVANLPANVKVGVVDVAIGGTKIEGFMSEKVADYTAPEADWLKAYFAAYDNDPYKRLVDMAKIAQQSGVIKGILLHQGESNNSQTDWPQKVKTVYDRLIADLNLNAADVPLFVGEVVNSTANGTCAYHNNIIANVPSVIPNSYVISSANCPAKPEMDGSILHFTAQGYRIMGQRYAKKALSLMGIDAQIEEPQIPSSNWVVDKRFTSLAEIGTTPFAIVNEDEGMAIYGVKNQDLGYGYMADAFKETNTGYMFKLENCSDVTDGYLLRLITPIGGEYTIWGSPGYLNGYSTQVDCSFILGLGQNNQNGQDVQNGAVWNIQYVEGKGFSLKNLYTGKYLKNAQSAKFEAPTYFTFCTLKQQTVAGVQSVTYREITDGVVYNLQGMKVSTEDEWENLPQGLYIINGKKIVKR